MCRNHLVAFFCATHDCAQLTFSQSLFACATCVNVFDTESYANNENKRTHSIPTEKCLVSMCGVHSLHGITLCDANIGNFLCITFLNLDAVISITWCRFACN